MSTNRRFKTPAHLDANPQPPIGSYSLGGLLALGSVGNSTMVLFKADRCRALSDECRSLALLSEDEIEKTILTNLSLSWNRIANQTDRHAEFMKKPKGK
jgi:hypothetical protein